MIELTYREGALSPERRSSLVVRLTEVLMTWEGVPDTEFFRDATWVQIHERPGWALNRAGGPVGETTYLVAATVPEGALSARRKAGLIEEVTQAVLAADGGSDDGYRVWVHVHEIPDGNWGADGKPVMFGELRAAAARARAGAAAPDGPGRE
ncbi:tautomerase family protein [Pseudonocardia sp. NPDC046786]|uniref:tautomerase family protein n=1 Tax=Pseudonocardia sp. NPDC046786 TaxID=3155471 RepID=UPI0033D397C1